MSKKIKKIDISEEDNIQDAWYQEAWDVTPESLPKFIKHIMNDYNHDYGTYCHALTACAIATVNAYGDQLSGFQASCIAILFPRHFFYTNTKTGISLRNWDDMLYPQYETKFDKVIGSNMWDLIQKSAKEFLESKEYKDAHPEVIKHWQSIADGNPPFGYRVVKSGD